jgi:GNAT superfamily N-acetyltransferase
MAVGADKFVVRRFGPEDSLPEITLLLHRAYARLAAMSLNFVATRQDDLTTAHRLSLGEGYVALLDGKIVGTITLKAPGTTHGCEWYDRKDVSVFNQFAVDPELQNQGLGSKMLDFVERRAKDLGASELALDTAEGAKHLIEYYEKRGYRVVGFVDWEPTNYVSVVMSKPLKY